MYQLYGVEVLYIGTSTPSAAAEQVRAWTSLEGPKHKTDTYMCSVPAHARWDRAHRARGPSQRARMRAYDRAQHIYVLCYWCMALPVLLQACTLL